MNALKNIHPYDLKNFKERALNIITKTGDEY